MDFINDVHILQYYKAMSAFCGNECVLLCIYA